LPASKKTIIIEKPDRREIDGTTIWKEQKRFPAIEKK
jgi:hypothetical protein